jgi:hypothetical protein
MGTILREREPNGDRYGAAREFPHLPTIGRNPDRSESETGCTPSRAVVTHLCSTTAMPVSSRGGVPGQRASASFGPSSKMDPALCC